nr:unnamed protein product [Digitaria exilis]
MVVDPCTAGPRQIPSLLPVGFPSPASTPCIGQELEMEMQGEAAIEPGDAGWGGATRTGGCAACERNGVWARWSVGDDIVGRKVEEKDMQIFGVSGRFADHTTRSTHTGSSHHASLALLRDMSREHHLDACPNTILLRYRHAGALHGRIIGLLQDIEACRLRRQPSAPDDVTYGTLIQGLCDSVEAD